MLVNLTLISSLFKAVIYLLEHGLTAALKHRKHNALEGVFVGCLDRTLHGFGCSSANSVGSVLPKKLIKCNCEVLTNWSRYSFRPKTYIKDNSDCHV